MKTMNCPYCGIQFSKNESSCPKCGAPNPKPEKVESPNPHPISNVGVLYTEDVVEESKTFNDGVFNTFQFVWGLGSFFGGLMAFANFVTYWSLVSLGILVLCILSSFFHLRTLRFIGKISGRDW